MESILTLALAVLITAIVVLAGIYLYMSYKSKIEEEGEKIVSDSDKKDKSKKGEYTKLSIFNFMQFDKIEDNMIIQDNGDRYLMVIGCEGINYDLMSSLEKTAGRTWAGARLGLQSITTIWNSNRKRNNES